MKSINKKTQKFLSNFYLVKIAKSMLCLLFFSATINFVSAQNVGQIKEADNQIETLNNHTKKLKSFSENNKNEVVSIVAKEIQGLSGTYKVGIGGDYPTITAAAAAFNTHKFLDQ